jgi:phosphohistidine swiveling domain-containing protein
MADLKPTPSEDLQRIIVSASRLGVELDEEEAMQWLTAIATVQDGTDITIDTQSGVFWSPHQYAGF